MKERTANSKPYEAVTTFPVMTELSIRSIVPHKG